MSIGYDVGEDANTSQVGQPEEWTEDMGLVIPEGLLGYTVNGTDSLNLPESTYVPPSGDSDWSDEKVGYTNLIQEYATTQPPGGYYEFKSPKVTANTRESEFYVKVADGFEKVNRIRKINTYSAQGILEKDGKTWKPFLRLRVSTEVGYAKNADGSVNPEKFDSPSKLLVQAAQACVKITGVAPEDLTYKQIDTFLRTYPLRVATFRPQGGNDLVITGIEGIRPE